MGKTSGKLTQCGEAVTLLLEASRLANPVGHQSDKPCGELGHFLHKLRKEHGRKAQDSSIGQRAAAEREFLHARERQHARNVTRFELDNQSFAAKLAAPLELALEQHRHGVCRVALPRVGIASLYAQILRLAEKPVDLIVG